MNNTEIIQYEKKKRKYISLHWINDIQVFSICNVPINLIIKVNNTASKFSYGESSSYNVLQMHICKHINKTIGERQKRMREISPLPYTFLFPPQLPFLKVEKSGENAICFGKVHRLLMANRYHFGSVSSQAP